MTACVPFLLWHGGLWRNIILSPLCGSRCLHLPAGEKLEARWGLMAMGKEAGASSKAVRKAQVDNILGFGGVDVFLPPILQSLHHSLPPPNPSLHLSAPAFFPSSLLFWICMEYLQCDRDEHLWYPVLWQPSGQTKHQASLGTGRASWVS